MRLVDSAEGTQWMREAAECALGALCTRSKCGCVIVSGGQIIGSGFNAPPGNTNEQRHCTDARDYTHKPQYDRTCCVHAEWRGILDAVAHHPERVRGAQLYFMRVDAKGQVLVSEEPYCTVCSRLALDAGISEFVLWQKAGITAYGAHEYNERSYANLNSVHCEVTVSTA